MGAVPDTEGAMTLLKVHGNSLLTLPRQGKGIVGENCGVIVVRCQKANGSARCGSGLSWISRQGRVATPLRSSSSHPVYPRRKVSSFDDVDYYSFHVID